MIIKLLKIEYPSPEELEKFKHELRSHKNSLAIMNEEHIDRFLIELKKINNSQKVEYMIIYIKMKQKFFKIILRSMMI